MQNFTDVSIDKTMNHGNISYNYRLIDKTEEFAALRQPWEEILQLSGQTGLFYRWELALHMVGVLFKTGGQARRGLGGTRR